MLEVWNFPCLGFYLPLQNEAEGSTRHKLILTVINLTDAKRYAAHLSTYCRRKASFPRLRDSLPSAKQGTT